MTAEQPKLSLTPVNLDDAKQFVTEVHRHHGPTAGHRFSSGARDESGTVRAVMTMGRAVAPKTDQMAVLEVTRVASDGCPNACSFLYGAACRIHRVHGFGYAQTFTLITEPGTSLIAAGWKPVGVVEPKTHRNGWGSRPGRKLNPSATNVPKIKWECRCGPDPRVPLAELRAQVREPALEVEAESA